ncbi:MAG: hypothetical protein C4534_01570 [Gaiellales bacterium]|nr:MAG: hypothetical protein C4534_01570 [Gaiellales bacterium]
MEETTTAPAKVSGSTETAITKSWRIGRAVATRQSLQIPPDATEEECETLIEMVSYLDDATPWWRGDAILQAENIHGEKYAQWVDILNTTEGYLRNLVWVCSVFPPEDRHPGRSYKHHQAVASVKDRDRRLALLEESFQEGTSSAELYEKAKGIRLIVEKQRSNKGGYRVITDPVWDDLIGVKGEIVTAENGPWLSYHGGMVKIPQAPIPVCAVCGEVLSHRVEDDKMIVEPCHH